MRCLGAHSSCNDDDIALQCMEAGEGSPLYTGTDEAWQKQSDRFVSRLLAHWDECVPYFGYRDRIKLLMIVTPFSLFLPRDDAGTLFDRFWVDSAEALTVLHVSHGGILNVLMPAVAKQRDIKWQPAAFTEAEHRQYKIRNCSISRVTMQELSSETDKECSSRWAGKIIEFAEGVSIR